MIDIVIIIKVAINSLNDSKFHNIYFNKFLIIHYQVKK